MSTILIPFRYENGRKVKAAPVIQNVRAFTDDGKAITTSGDIYECRKVRNKRRFSHVALS